jgi:ankyrin repeat protein
MVKSLVENSNLINLLTCAIKFNDPDLLKLVCKTVNEVAGKDLLSYAIAYDKVDIVKVLLRDVYPDLYGSTKIIIDVLKSDNPEMLELVYDKEKFDSVKSLIQFHEDPSQSNLLFHAIKSGKYKMADFLMKNGADLFAQSASGDNIIIHLINCPDRFLSSLVIDNILDNQQNPEKILQSLVEQRNKKGITPLMQVIQLQDSEILSKLIRDYNVSFESTVMEFADDPEKLALIGNKIYMIGMDIAISAVTYGNVEMLKLVYDKTKFDSIKSLYKYHEKHPYNNLLQIAVEHNSYKMIDFLIDEGANPLTTPENILAIAVNSNNGDMLKFLISKIKKIDAKERKTQTDYQDILPNLMNKTARLGKTPLSLAISLGHTKIVDILNKAESKSEIEEEEEEEKKLKSAPPEEVKEPKTKEKKININHKENSQEELLKEEKKLRNNQQENHWEELDIKEDHWEELDIEKDKKGALPNANPKPKKPKKSPESPEGQASQDQKKEKDKNHQP